MTTATSDLRELIGSNADHAVAIRHTLHRHPELSFKEHETCALIRDELDRLGIAHVSGYARGTGVVAHLPAAGPATEPATEPAERGGSIALRADIDALPIQESSGVEHASRVPGVMHACGHDGHTAILLGAARVLASLERRPSPVTLLFQPAEEGGGGGELMAREGALAGVGAGGLGPPVRTIFGLHGWPEMDLGTVGTRPGPLLASTDDFEITFRGKQGHAAWPHESRDPIVCAAHAITALQTIASRSADPADAVVCTVGAIHGGTADNVIPETVSMIGTLRALDDTNRAMLERRLHEIAEGAARTMGCEAEIDFKPGYPVTRNDADAAARFFDIAGAAFGADRVERVPRAFMGGEDFSYYGAHAPACFFLLGLRPLGSAMPGLHNAGFDFTDEAVEIGIEAMVRLALEA